MTVIIENDKIAELKAEMHSQAAGEGERVFDLEGGYVLPGLWDVHVHLGDLIPDPKHLLETESPIDYAIRAGRNSASWARTTTLTSPGSGPLTLASFSGLASLSAAEPCASRVGMDTVRWALSK